MPQMSPMNWMFLSISFLIIISLIKSTNNMSQKNESQKSTMKPSLQNMIKW